MHLFLVLLIHWLFYLIRKKSLFSGLYRKQKITSHSSEFQENMELISNAINLIHVYFPALQICLHINRMMKHLYTVLVSLHRQKLPTLFFVLHWRGWTTWVCTLPLTTTLTSLWDHSHTLIVFALKYNAILYFYKFSMLWLILDNT